MESFRLIDRKVRYIAVAGAMVLATVIPALVSAAQVTERSIELSSSAAAATGVSYKVNFKPAADAGAFVVDFCSNTPLYGEDCTAPTGFNVGTPTSATSGFTTVAKLGANDNKLRVTGAMTAGNAVSVDIAGITNPSATGPLYARIVTFNNATNADLYVSNPVEPAVNTGMVDNGSVALSIVNSIGVSGAVLETMTFCVSGATITDSCNSATSGVMTPPTLKLGKAFGDVIAMDSSQVFEGSIYTQISTNAASGAVISLKSNAVNCGGLLRAGAPSACDIGPAGTADTITAGEALFGVKTGATSTDADGTIRAFNTGNYDATNFRMNYVAGNTSGVTGPYGDPILDTASLPANNKNMQLTFGASVANNTPAGLYSADLNLIATGKF